MKSRLRWKLRMYAAIMVVCGMGGLVSLLIIVGGVVQALVADASAQASVARDVWEGSGCQER